MSCPQVYSDAVYVLGALSPAERSAYEEHLAGCPECAAAVARLAPIPGLLSRVDPAVLESTPPSPAQLPQLLRQARVERRRQTRVRRLQLALAAAMAAVVTAGGVVTASALTGTGSPEPGPAPVAMELVGASSPVQAQVAVAPAPGGTQVRMSCWYPPTAYEVPAQTFRLLAVATDGSTEQLGSWQAGGGEQVSMTGLTRFTDELARLVLTTVDGTPLLSHEVS